VGNSAFAYGFFCDVDGTNGYTFVHPVARGAAELVIVLREAWKTSDKATTSIWMYHPEGAH